MLKRIISVVIGVALLGGAVGMRGVTAQDSEIRVPDVTGLNVPQAAALLNQAGLRLGAEGAVAWSPDSPVAQDTISAQSPAAGTSAAFGAAVALTVLRSTNALLVYDDNDITLVNQTGAPLPLAAITFAALDGSTPAMFEAARWGGVLEAGDCGQLWSLSRREPKDLPECTEAMLWSTTNDPAQHFWTGTNGAARFAILQDGVERAVCPVAAAGTCPVFLANGTGGGDVIDYVYFAYTTDQLLLINPSQDRWMPLAALRIGVEATTDGAALPLAAQSDAPETVLGDVLRLAPGQCLWFKADSIDVPLEPCAVTAQFTTQPDALFWRAAFFVTGTDGERRECAAAIADSLTLCLLPR